jgi:hypothetical protein
LAKILNVNAQSLRRFLLMMTVLNLLTQTDQDSFKLSPLGQLLRSDHPESIRERINYIGEVNYPAAQGMSHAVQTGETAFEHVFGTPFFDFLAKRQDLGELFNRQMSQAVQDRIKGILSAYDFSQAATIIDIGGGNGALLMAILRAHPLACGVLVDVANVAAEARNSLASTEVASRVEIREGDFFQGPLPAGGDLYLLSNIIHDWDDRRALQILLNCRAVIPKTSRLLLIEQIMPLQAIDTPATVASDFSMLLLTRGKERTEPEYRALLSAAELELTKVFPIVGTRIYSGRKSNWVILESVPV